MTFLDEIQRYVGFDAHDARLLSELGLAIHDELPGVVERFYQSILRHDSTRAILSGGDGQIARLKQTMGDWLASGLAGPHDEAYYRERSHIGRRHVAIGLPQHYMFTSMNQVRRDLHRLAVAAAIAELDATHAAIDRLLDLELAIMLRHYQLEAEERLVQRERDAQTERLASLQRLSAGLAHEVRNPLNAANLQLELLERRLRRQPDADPALLKVASLVGDEIGRLSELLNEFLAFARPVQLTVNRTDLVALVRHVVELERPAAAVSHVNLTFVAPDGVVEAEVDGQKVHQVLLNLLRNAVEASPPRTDVDVTVGCDDGHATITVRDHGPGIPPEVYARIYEPFFSTKEGGTGMGLAIVQSLVTLHGGRILLDVDEGTRFTVVLPRNAAN